MSATIDTTLPDFLDAKLTRPPERLAEMERAVARMRKNIRNPGRNIKNPRRYGTAAARALGASPGFLRSTGAQPVKTKEATMAKKPTKTKKATLPSRNVPKKGATVRKPRVAQMTKLATAEPKKPATGNGKTKWDLLEDQLRGNDGATIVTICAVTGWQKHSARAAISRLPERIKERDGGKLPEVATVKNAAGDTVYSLPAKAA